MAMLYQEDPNIQRRRQLAQAMMAQSQQQGPVQHWSQGLNRVLSAGLGAYQNQKADQEAEEKRKQFQQELQGAFGSGDMNELAKAIAPMDSGMATQIQMSQMQQQQAAEAARRAREQKLKDEMFMHDFKNRGPDTPVGKLIQERDALPENDPRRSIYDQMIDKKTSHSPGTTVNVDTTGNAFDKEFGKMNARQFFESREAAQGAAKSLGGIQRAKQLLDEGVFTGMGANFKVGFGKALQTMGINFAEDEVANSEAFLAAQAQQVANIIKQFGAGTGLSDKDREFAEKAAGGQISMTEESLRRILNINEEASRNVIEGFNNQAEHISSEMSPYPLTVEMPEMHQGGTTGSPEASEVASPSTQEEYDALPSGAIFIDPDDGKRYRKP